MKVAAVVLLAVSASAYDQGMTRQWERMKAQESCWGQQNMNLHTVNMKKAVAKCGHQDAPELHLPPFRSSYRFVNTMMNKADRYENMGNLFQQMMRSMSNSDSFSNNYDMSGNQMDQMQMMRMMMKMMQQNKQYDNSNYNMMESFRDMFRKNNMNSNSFGQGAQMSQLADMFSRSKRQAGRRQQPPAGRRPAQGSPVYKAADNLSVGDRLVERLADQKMEMNMEIGNFTCVMREMNQLDASNNLDRSAMKEEMQKFAMPSQWFGRRFEELVDTCYQLATNLPQGITTDSIITGDNFGTVKMAELKAFFDCKSKRTTELCMDQDIKTKVETNFGAMEAILEETGLTEHEFLPLVTQLLHGQEMDFMYGDF